MTTHGHKKNEKRSLTYKSWLSMKSRCYYKNSCNYKYYGAKGIKVCDRWKDSFENFLEDMGERPKNCSLDRIDNNQGYSPSNCKWSTKTEQTNNKSTNRKITYNSQTMTLVQWSRHLNIHVETIRKRLDKGWSIEDVLTRSVKKHKVYKARNK